MTDNPPFRITSHILALAERIGEAIGRAEEATLSTDLRLPRINHPLEDGNGRMGRPWQTLILTRWKPLFADVPVESRIHERQSEYYDAIRESSDRGESTTFIAFMLETILEAIWESGSTDQVSDQVPRLLVGLRDGPKTATELMAALGLSHRPTFRSNYIRPALSARLVEMTRPESPTAKNQKYRLTTLGQAATP